MATFRFFYLWQIHLKLIQICYGIRIKFWTFNCLLCHYIPKETVMHKVYHKKKPPVRFIVFHPCHLLLYSVLLYLLLLSLKLHKLLILNLILSTTDSSTQWLLYYNTSTIIRSFAIYNRYCRKFKFVKKILHQCDFKLLCNKPLWFFFFLQYSNNIWQLF